MDFTGSWPLKTCIYLSINSNFSTANRRYLLTVANAIHNDQLLKALGFSNDWKWSVLNLGNYKELYVYFFQFIEV